MCARLRWASSALLVALVGLANAGEPPAGQLRAIDVSSRLPAADAELWRKLAQQIPVDWKECRIERLCSFLKGYGITSRVDWKSIRDSGISTEVPLPAIHARSISIRGLLSLALENVGLRFVPTNGEVLITTPDTAELAVTARIYPVADLVRYEGDGNQEDDFDTLIELITTTVSPQTWDEVGGPANVGMYQGMLVIRQTWDVHETIELLLEGLRRSRAALDHARLRGPIWCEMGEQRQAAIQFNHQADKPCHFAFAGLPLQAAAQKLGELMGLPVVLDHEALTEQAVDVNMPVSLTAHAVPVSAALEEMLAAADPELTCVIRQGGLVVTSQDKASLELVVAVHPIRDLLTDQEFARDADRLIETITYAVEPSSWDEVGGPGSIAPFVRSGALVIDQTRDVHEQIARLLDAMRKLRKRLPPPAAPPNERSARVEMSTRVYPVPAESEVDTIVSWLEPDLQVSPESEIYARVAHGQLVVRASRQRHREIERLLDGKLKPVRESGGGCFVHPHGVSLSNPGL